MQSANFVSARHVVEVQPAICNAYICNLSWRQCAPDSAIWDPGSTNFSAISRRHVRDDQPSFRLTKIVKISELILFFLNQKKAL